MRTVPILVTKHSGPRVGAVRRWDGFGSRMSRAEIEAKVAGMKGKPRAENVAPPPRPLVLDPLPTELARRQFQAHALETTFESESPLAGFIALGSVFGLLGLIFLVWL